MYAYAHDKHYVWGGVQKIGVDLFMIFDARRTAPNERSIPMPRLLRRLSAIPVEKMPVDFAVDFVVDFAVENSR